MSATFESLYDEYGTRIYQYLLGQVRRVDVAEDLLQTVMLRVVRKRWTSPVKSSGDFRAAIEDEPEEL